MNDAVALSREENYFLKILSDYLNRRGTAKKDGLNWNVLRKLASDHQVAGIVFYQCRNFIPGDVRSFFEASYASAVCSCMNRQADMEELGNALRKADIPWFLVKGLSVSAYYPVPELRTMSDTDLVVRPEDRPRAGELFLEHGFQEKSRSNEEWHYDRRGMNYELHDHLLYEDIVNGESFRNFINDCWDYVHDDRMDPSFHFLFLLLHLRKHLLQYGIGFRQFMDLAAMAQREPALDWDWISGRLADFQMTGFASVCFGLIRRWFGISVPAETKELSDSFFRTATKHILSGGVFGFSNEENSANTSVNHIRNDGSRRISILLTGIGRVFPPYHTLRNYEGYSYLDGRPYLMPAAYLQRVAKVIRYLPRRKLVMKSFFPSEEIVEKRKAYLAQWELPDEFTSSGGR